MTREDFVYQAITKLRVNKGIDTPGVDLIGLDGTSSFYVSLFIQEIKDFRFRFQPVRRIMIPKPGKVEKRPLGDFL
jgi:retron-type reverse transcriptase